MEDEEEQGRPYELKRELALPEPASDVVWSHGKLIVCTRSAVRVLDRDGTELRCISTTGTAEAMQDDEERTGAAADGGPPDYAPYRAVVVEARGDRPQQQVAVLDTQGNLHFYT